MIADHYNAVLALLPSDVTAYKGDVPSTPTYPYVVLWGDGGTADTEALSDNPTTLTLKLYATVAGQTFDSAAIILQRVRTALNRARPSVPNRVTSRMIQTPQMPIQADLSVSIPGVGHPFYAVDQYDLISDPA